MSKIPQILSTQLLMAVWILYLLRELEFGVVFLFLESANNTDTVRVQFKCF